MAGGDLCHLAAVGVIDTDDIMKFNVETATQPPQHDTNLTYVLMQSIPRHSVDV